MRITRRGQLAVTLMVDFAVHTRHGPLPLKMLSVRHRVSMSLVESIAAALRRHCLLYATRGPGGGYSLGREAAAISVADIVVAIESPSATPRTPARRANGTDQHRLTAELWESVRHTALDFLRSKSLQALAGMQRPWGFPLPERPIAITAGAVPPTVPKHIANSVFDLARVGA